MKEKNSVTMRQGIEFNNILIEPKYSDFDLSDIDIATNITDSIKLQIPIIASPMDTLCDAAMATALGKYGGMGVIHRNQSISTQCKAVESVASQKLIVGGAIGIKGDALERARALEAAGASLLFIDYAIGDSAQAVSSCKELLQSVSIPIVASGLATAKAAQRYLDMGILTLRYGMGAGSICISRELSGVGVPQVSALLDLEHITSKHFVIADGGITSSGDIVKALALGADAVMLGSLLSGTEETPGEIIEKDGVLYKEYRGLGSQSSMSAGSADRYNQKADSIVCEEGVSKLVPYHGSVIPILEKLTYGIRTGMMKAGAKTIRDLQNTATIIVSK